MTPRFFADETDLGLGRRLEEKFPGRVVYPGHPDLIEVPRGQDDDEWMAVVGGKGLVVVTRDKRIRWRPVLKAKWVRFEVRGFVLTGRKNQSTEGSLAVLEMHWSRIEGYIQQHPHGPWMCAVTMEGLRGVPLER